MPGVRVGRGWGGGSWVGWGVRVVSGVRVGRGVFVAGTTSVGRGVRVGGGTFSVGRAVGLGSAGA
jgi:UDP-3-O-[3-hydroxymyristoyl] glucosamine N-acyltransferase